MEDLIRMFGAPKFLRTDNGSEFIAKALVRWLKDQDVQSRFIDPRSPWQNGRSERSNGTLRNEFLNQEVFHFGAFIPAGDILLLLMDQFVLWRIPRTAAYCRP
jgi:transposase InsO family protein